MSKFTELASKLDKKPGVSTQGSKKLAAFIGIKKYGKKKFFAKAAAGRRKK